MSTWVLKLTDGNLMIGDVEDNSASLIEMKNPKILTKNSYGFQEKTDLPAHFSIYTDVIYIERTAIVYWAKPQGSKR